MDIIKLYEDHNVDYKTQGHKHCRPGWVNTPCPFCVSEPGHEGYHLGFPLNGNLFVCWRCGPHPLVQGVSKLLNIPKKEAYYVVKKYKGNVNRVQKPKDAEIGIEKFMFPSNTLPVTEKHKRYLAKRGFDPDWIIKKWDILGTGIISRLDGQGFQHRIIIPVYWEQDIVSFQARDITNKSELKYIACSKKREKIHHKHIIYGDSRNWDISGTGIVTEGVTDVWRLGHYSVATFGIKYKKEQVRILAKLFKRVPVIYDDEPQAVEQAEKLVAELIMRGVDSFRVPIIGDPGSLSQDDANHLVNQLIKKIY